MRKFDELKTREFYKKKYPVKWSKQITIELDGSVRVYNAISPNGDGKNEIMRIANIELFTKNHVSVFNRWGDLVFETDDYNNDDRVFKGVSNGGKDLPSGIYYYKIEFPGGQKTRTGYLSLRRQARMMM